MTAMAKSMWPGASLTRLPESWAKKKAELAKLQKNGVSLRSVKSRDYRYIRAYNLSTRDWSWSAAQPFELAKDQRAGILTHPAWLVAHSVNDGNHPIHRGIWVYEKLLAGVIADVPPDVDARVPEDSHMTLRHRLEVVRDAAPCKMLDMEIGDGARTAMRRRAGVICRVIAGGSLLIGDVVDFGEPG